MEAKKYHTLRVRLTDSELETLRALPGDNDSDRTRRALSRLGQEHRIVSAVAQELLGRIDARLAKALEAEREKTAQRAAELIGAKLHPILKGIVERLPVRNGGD